MQVIQMTDRDGALMLYVTSTELQTLRQLFPRDTDSVSTIRHDWLYGAKVVVISDAIGAQFAKVGVGTHVNLPIAPPTVIVASTAAVRESITNALYDYLSTPPQIYRAPGPLYHWFASSMIPRVKGTSIGYMDVPPTPVAPRRPPAVRLHGSALELLQTFLGYRNEIKRLGATYWRKYRRMWLDALLSAIGARMGTRWPG